MEVGTLRLSRRNDNIASGNGELRLWSNHDVLASRSN